MQTAEEPLKVKVKHDLVLVKGNTYPVKERLRQMGFDWVDKCKIWVAPFDMENLTAALFLSIQFKVLGEAAMRGTKLCLRCGRLFTFSQCMLGGNWKRGMCGCHTRPVDDGTTFSI